MISEKVITLARQFREFCNEKTVQYPEYQLDLTWPSIGTVDLFTSTLRKKKSLNEAEVEFLHGASALIAGIASDAWKHFPDSLEVSVAFDEQRGGVVLEARGGGFLAEGESQEVALSSALGEILRELPHSFSYFQRHTRLLPEDYNFVSLFAGGVAAGLSPYGKGGWRKKSLKHFSHYLGTAEQYLARTSADYYKRVFPNEPIGAESELYLANLLLPPATIAEPFPSARGVRSVLEYVREKNIASSELPTLFENLARSPDELISSVGFVLSAALCSAEPKPRLVAIGKSKSQVTPKLRPALQIALGELKREKDWFDVFKRGDIPRAQSIADKEATLGFLPYLFFPLDRLRDEALLSTVEALSWSDLAAAEIALAGARDATTLTSDGELLYVFLLYLMGDVKRAREVLNQFVLDNSGDYSNLEDVYFLEAHCLRHEGKKEKALKLFQKASEQDIPDIRRKVLYGHHYAGVLLELGEHKQALRELNRLITYEPFSVDIKLDCIAAFRALGDSESVEQELKDLSAYATSDRRVFAQLFL